MLYVHMAVLIDELFFPQYDTHVNRLLAVFSFCSTFIFIPLGVYYLADNIGRESTVIITTILMSFSCIVMVNLPTYAQVGASCRLYSNNMPYSARYVIHGSKSRSRIIFNGICWSS